MAFRYLLLTFLCLILSTSGYTQQSLSTASGPGESITLLMLIQAIANAGFYASEDNIKKSIFTDNDAQDVTSYLEKSITVLWLYPCSGFTNRKDQSTDDTNSFCGLCYEHTSIEGSVVCSECSTTFHQSCLDRTEAAETCPLCRQPTAVTLEVTRLTREANPDPEATEITALTGAMSRSCVTSLPSTNQPQPSIDMQGPFLHRLNSFKHHEHNFTVSVGKLAEAGFLRPVLSRDRVICPYCNQELDDWGPSDTPWVEHAHYRKKCTIVQQKLKDINGDQITWKSVQCRASNDNEDNEKIRFNSFKGHEKHFKVSCKALATAGFSCNSPSPDLVRCADSGEGYDYWKEGDLPLVEHLRHEPECIFPQQWRMDQVAPFSAQDVTGFLIIEGWEQLPDNMDSYEQYQARLTTFIGHENEFTLPVSEKAAAGFRLVGDRLVCDFCFFSTSSAAGDPPWIEHYNMNGNCRLVRARIELIQKYIQKKTSKKY